MDDFIRSVVYVCLLGVLSNPMARLIDRDKIDHGKFPFREFAFEKGGKIYEKIGIRRKDKVPDMSVILKKLIRKEVRTDFSAADIRRQIQETCVAEFVHLCLILLSLTILVFWKSFWAWIFEAAYILLANLPFMLIQRYNRPRLIKLYRRKLRTEG